MDNQPNNRPPRIQGRWRNIINISFFLLAAVALFLRLSNDDNSYWNFLPSNNEEGGHHRHLLRDISRRTAQANCSKHNKRRRRCNRTNRCAFIGNACVPQETMMMQFASLPSNHCSKHNGKGRRCRRNGCAWNKSNRTCKKPDNSCEPFNRRARSCNNKATCVFNGLSRKCEQMTQTSMAINVCTKKRYKSCKGHSSCIWKNRVCSLKDDTIVQQTATQATQQVTTTTTTTTTKATQAAGSTTCWEWHPLPGQTGGTPVW